MKPKTLIFEGVGWNKAESCGDVGNCRIRTTFLNKAGSEIYLELIAIKPHRWSLEKQKCYQICGVVDFLFYTSDRRSGYSKRFSRLNKMYFEWTKENILHLVNSRDVGGDFEEIDVRDDWNGFRVDGTSGVRS